MNTLFVIGIVTMLMGALTIFLSFDRKVQTNSAITNPASW
jgi:hypothetical protein